MPTKPALLSAHYQRRAGSSRNDSGGPSTSCSSIACRTPAREASTVRSETVVSNRERIWAGTTSGW